MTNDETPISFGAAEDYQRFFCSTFIITEGFEKPGLLVRIKAREI